MTIRRPTTLLAEVTYRCPMHCPYCSNPVDLALGRAELSTEEWMRVFSEARALGVLQLGISGGEPLVRKDVEALVAHARREGLYTTLVTSGLGLTRERGASLAMAGIDHIQISIQDAVAEGNDRIGGLRTWEKKHAAAAVVRDLGVAFTVNAVLHRANLDRIGEIIDLAASLGADRIECANTQYYGWAALNRAALMPTRAQVERAERVATEKAAQYKGRMQVLYVLPDYYQEFPKPCMGGWGSVYIVVAPDGRALPCQAASQITTLTFESVREHALEWIWTESPAFAAFRGDAWMAEPCRSCPRKVVDFGGCRCQAFALTGDARNADPVCALSPHHRSIEDALAEASGEASTAAYTYRWLERPAAAAR
jgi:PqqA peptide cyclase